MHVLGLAATITGFVRKIGVAGVAASTLTASVLENSDGTSLLEWLLRGLVAIFQIALGWPAGTEFSIADILLQLFGESIASAIEDILTKITAIPEIVGLLADLLEWAQVAMIVGMFIGIGAYWTAYVNQTNKSQKMEDEIWEGKTLIVDPWNWTWKRLLPITAILVVALRILHTFVVEGYDLMVKLVLLIYSGAGTTTGEAFEETLRSLADSGVFGIPAFVAVMVVLFVYSIRLLSVYAKRFLRFIVAHFFVLFELGKFLDGSRLTSMADPFKKYLQSFLLLAGTILFGRLAPLISSRFSGLFGTLVLIMMLDIARDYPRLIDKWFGGRFTKFRGAVDSAGDWIAQDLEDVRMQAAYAENEQKPGVFRRAVSWTGDQVSKHTPRKIKKVASIGKELAKLDPKIAAGLGAAEALTRTLKDDKAVAREIHKNMTEGRFSRGRTAKPNPRWDRDAALAKSVAEREPLFSLIGELSTNRDYAVFYELARIFHSRTQVERVEVVKERIESKLTDNQVSELSDKGRKVARDARDMRKEGEND